jgi:TRAP-type mannitol/chloroaromatic compound transport system permease small subunit
MQKLRYVLSIIDQISEQSGKICSYGILLIVILMFYEVVLRYVLNAPSNWNSDVVQFLFGGIAVLAGAYTLHHNSHINVDVIYRYFSPRIKLAIDVVASVFFFAFCGVMFWFGLEFAASSIAELEVTQTPFGGPVYLVKATIPIGAALIILQGLAKLTRDVIALITKAELLPIFREETQGRKEVI